MLNLKKKNLKSDSGRGVLLSLKKYKEPHKKRKMIYFLSTLMILSLGIFIFYKSFAFYEEKKDFNVINGVVEDPGDLYFAYYVNNTITRDFPTKDSGLTLDTTKSSCTSGVTISWDDEKWEANLNYSNYQKNSTTRTKCTLYFKAKPPLATTLLNNLVSGANKSSTDVYTVPDKTSSSCTYTLAYDGTSDNNLRYVGANPCNYVTFNGEKAGWRIIGILNTPEGQRMKLIRTNSLGNYSWDNKASGTGSSTSSYGSNDWTDSTLKEVLNNGAYYNKTSGTCPSDKNGATTSCDFTSNGLTETAKNQIDTITWKLGGTADFESSSNGLASHWYTYERGTTVYEGRPTEWQGKVGLLYPSDYGYATSGGTSMNRASCLATELYNWRGADEFSSVAYASDCYNNDWLYNSIGWQWTLTPDSSVSYRVFYVESRGHVFRSNFYPASAQSPVLPSVYLISKTSILGGEGTLENPYEIG